MQAAAPPALGGRFRSFSFVDRITLRAPGRIEGLYTVPAGVSHFPASLMAEAVGQLAAWSAMSQLDFAWRPVAGLAGAAHYHQQPLAGQTLVLEADLERCDPEAVAYRGCARINGQLALELVDCVGPMLPMADFDSPAAVRGDFQTLIGSGAQAGRFAGVPKPRLSDLESGPGERLLARLTVPPETEAPYFQDHFPSRPVFPGTLLLDAMAALAVQLAAQAEPLRGRGPLLPRLVRQVKIRSFTLPGSVLQLEAERVEADPFGARLKVSARAEGKTVATARIDVGLGETA